MGRTFFLFVMVLLGAADLSLAEWDRNYIGVNYKGFPQSTAEITADLEVLGPRFGYIRTYNSLFGPSSPENAVAGLVNAYNTAHPTTPIKVALGVALTPGNATASQTELDQAIANAKAYPQAVNAVVIGNENYGNFTAAQLVAYMNYAKAQLSGMGVAVTTCQQWGVLAGADGPALVNAATSYVLANIYPYWDGPGYTGGNQAQAGADTLKKWQAQFLTSFNKLSALYGPGKIHIGETGWPSQGSQVMINGVWTGIPSQTAALPNEQTYIEQYARWASAKNLSTYLFAAFDESWKQEQGGVGPHWGLYTAARQPKWTLGQLPAVNAGSTLELGTNSPYGDLAFNGGTLLIVDPETTWGNGFSTSTGTTSTLDNGGNALTHTGTLTGSGNLIHTGTGTTTHQGDGSGFTGTYTVAAGTLNLSNTLGSAAAPCTVVVSAGGALSGIGPLAGSLTNRGTVNPGNSPGTLNMVGTFTQTSGATMIAEIASPTSYDRVNVTGAPGTASLDGTLSPTRLDGYFPSINQVFAGIVQTTGGLTGTFSTITNQRLSRTLFWQPVYRADRFDLQAVAHYTYPDLGLNSNQFGVGNMLNRVAGSASGDLVPALDAINTLTTNAGVQDALKQISPEKAGALTTLGFAGATFQVRHLATRITNLRFAPGGNAGVSSLSPGGLRGTYSQPEGVMLAYNGASLANLFSGRKELRAPESRWGLFVDGGAAFGSQKSSANQTGFDFTLGGVTAGADYRVRDHLLLGLATGYSHTSSGFYGSGGGVTANTVPFNAYAAYFPGSLYAYGSLGYALNLFDLHRNLNFGGLSRTARSSTTGHQFNLYSETGYDLQLGRCILTPAATLSYSHLWVDSFTEQDAGALNLQVSSETADSLQTGVGGRLTVPLQVGRVKVVPQGYAFYQHEFANGSRGLNARLSQGGRTFTFQTDAAQRNFAVVGASVTVGIRKNLVAQVNYNAEVGRSNSTAHYVNAGLRIEF